jgi:hypothetical protein
MIGKLKMLFNEFTVAPEFLEACINILGTTDSVAIETALLDDAIASTINAEYLRITGPRKVRVSISQR